MAFLLLYVLLLFSQFLKSAPATLRLSWAISDCVLPLKDLSRIISFSRSVRRLKNIVNHNFIYNSVLNFFTGIVSSKRISLSPIIVNTFIILSGGVAASNASIRLSAQFRFLLKFRLLSAVCSIFVLTVLHTASLSLHFPLTFCLF